MCRPSVFIRGVCFRFAFIVIPDVAEQGIYLEGVWLWRISGGYSQEMTGAGVRVSFLVLSFSTTNYHNPNLFCRAPPFSGQGPETITLLSPQGPHQLPDPSPMDHPRTLQRWASHRMAQHSYEETPSEYPISQPPKSTVVVRWLWHSIKRTVFKQMKFVLDKVIGDR